MGQVQATGDPHAFAQLMNRWQTPIRNLCTRMTGDSHRAEDLTQEAFARVFAYRKNYRPSARFSTYLWRIAINLCHDELRRTQRKKETALDDLGEESLVLLEEFVSKSPSPDRVAEQKETADSVRRALGRLPDIYRVVLVLRHYEQLKFQEIAEILEIPEGTVKSRMSEGLNQLGRLLRPSPLQKSSPLKSERETILI